VNAKTTAAKTFTITYPGNKTLSDIANGDVVNVLFTQGFDVDGAATLNGKDIFYKNEKISKSNKLRISANKKGLF
jgi:hypothetical protein